MSNLFLSGEKKMFLLIVFRSVASVLVYVLGGYGVFCVSYVEMQEDIVRTDLIFTGLMERLTVRPQVAAPIAGDDGEAMANTHWYAACVRMNCEKRFQTDIEEFFKKEGHPLETWIAVQKQIRLNSRGKRVVREIVVLSTFVFVRVRKAHLNAIRFRSDVYRMLSEPGTNVPYVIPDKQIEDVRRVIDSGAAEILNHTIVKGDKVRVIDGELTGVVAYVQRVQRKTVVIACEIRNVIGAAIEISRDQIEYFK